MTFQLCLICCIACPLSIQFQKIHFSLWKVLFVSFFRFFFSTFLSYFYSFLCVFNVFNQTHFIVFNRSFYYLNSWMSNPAIILFVDFHMYFVILYCEVIFCRLYLGSFAWVKRWSFQRDFCFGFWQLTQKYHQFQTTFMLISDLRGT